MKSLVILFVCLCLSACNNFKPITREPSATFTLDQVVASQKKVRQNNKTILVTKTTANPGYKSAKMIYVEQPHHLKAFTKNKWVSPPATMLTPLVAQSIRNTNQYQAVLTPTFSGLTDFTLNTQLVQLQQEFMTRESQVTMVVDAQIINTANSKVLATKRFKSTVKADQNNPYGGVVAANKATKEILSQLIEFCLQKSS